MEVLLSLFIISFGVLGIAALEIQTLRETQESYWQSVAITQLQSMFERLRANPSIAYSYECSLWNLENTYLLPAAQGSCLCAANECQLSLHWGKNPSRTLSLQMVL